MLQLNIKFHKITRLRFELHFPQNFEHKYTHTQMFSKNRGMDKRENPLKFRNRNFSKIILSSIYIEKVI